MLEFRHPLPVKTPIGEGYALYVQSGGTFENDVWCVVLDDSRILHFRSNQLQYVGNATFDLQKPSPVFTSKLAEATAKLAKKARVR